MTHPLVTPDQIGQLKDALVAAGYTWLRFCLTWKLRRLEFAGPEAMDQDTWRWAMDWLASEKKEGVA